MKAAKYIYTGAASFATVYCLLAGSGIASGPSTSMEGVIFSMPMLIASFVVFCAAASEFYFMGKADRLVVLGVWMLGVAFLCAGFWTSALTRYSVSSVITEGQVIDTQSGFEVISGLGYAGKFARPPKIAIELGELAPVLSSDGRSLKSISGTFDTFIDGKSGRIVLHDSFGVNGLLTRLSISDFGYSPRYELIGDGGAVLDSSFVYLKLFPPGTEDSFRLLSPLTYYLRYYPSGMGEAAPAKLHVRITRNKDIAFNSDVMLGEQFTVENAAMAFPEVRRWTIVRITRDYGLPIAILGGIVVVFAAYLRLRKQKH